MDIHGHYYRVHSIKRWYPGISIDRPGTARKLYIISFSWAGYTYSVHIEFY
jgi:hypothetical protein